MRDADLACFVCTLKSPACDDTDIGCGRMEILRANDARTREAYRRTESYRESIKRYQQSDKYKETQRRYREASPDVIREARRNWVVNNRERKNELNREYRKRNPDVIRESRRNWDINNRARKNEMNRAYRMRKRSAIPPKRETGRDEPIN